jgi:hypothetical protein
MELLDQYLQSVKRHLPWERQDDILAELRVNLEAQLEDKEAECGRPLTKEEIEEWLKQVGSPLQVAGRYRRQQYLIGPALFPIYWFVLRLVLGWCAILYSITKAVEIAAKGLGADAIISAALGLPWTLLISAAFITLAFAAIEIAATLYPEKFNPLAAMSAWPQGMTSPFDADREEHKKTLSFAKALAEVIFGFLFLGWLLLVPHYPYLLFGPGEWYLASLPYKLAPVWWTFYWCCVGINGFELTWKTVDFATGGAWQKRKNWRHLAMHTLSLIPLVVLVSAPDQALFLLKSPVANAAARGAQLATANKGVHTALAIAIGIVALQILWMAGKMGVETYRRRVSAMR